MMVRLVVTALIPIFLVACGVRYDDPAQAPRLSQIKSTEEIAVGVVDWRPYVTSGRKDPKFAGITDGGYGIPENIYTRSGDPLVDDFADTVVNGLNTSGARARKVSLPPKSKEHEAIQALLNSGAKKFLLITVHEWNVDYRYRDSLAYDLMATVYDGEGRILARESVKQERTQLFTHPANQFREAVQTLLSKKELSTALE